MTPRASIAAFIVVVSSGMTSCTFDSGPLFTTSQSSGVQAAAPESGVVDAADTVWDSGSIATGDSSDAAAVPSDETDADTEPVADAAPAVQDASQDASEPRDEGATPVMPPPDAGPGPPAPDEGCRGVRETVRVEQTIVVASGQTFDGTCRRFTAGRMLQQRAAMDGSDEVPMFRLQSGASMMNVVFDSAGVDGIHTFGNARLRNVEWESIGDEALTVRRTGTVVIEGGRASNGRNSVFQINADATFRVSDMRAFNAGKFIRQNNGATYRADVFIERCDIAGMREAIFRTDSSATRLTMTESRYSRIGGELFPGVNPQNIVLRDNQEY